MWIILISLNILVQGDQVKKHIFLWLVKNKFNTRDSENIVVYYVSLGYTLDMQKLAQTGKRMKNWFF